ncbi:MAG: HAMP domain-containing histidine kinase, partial [Pedobacter sp.]
VQLQLKSKLEERNLKLATIISDSSIRIRGLIDNILDFAMGRLGGGINLNYDHDEHCEIYLKQVVTELELAWPEIQVELIFALSGPVRMDHKRIAQLFSNLLGNSISHGDRSQPIIVKASNPGNEFHLSITNSGKRIADNIMSKLFSPFSRGKINPGQEGLGLGLYISNEIAKAHGGHIQVASDDEKTTFTLIIPC